MDKTDAAAAKRKKTSWTKPAMGISVAGKPNTLPIGSGAPFSTPAFFQPLSLQCPEEPCQGPEALRSSVRSLSCRHWRTGVVSCKDEEFEVGCQSTSNSGGVWRNAGWGYIKHWLMLRNHEFWKIQLRNKQNLKLHVAYKSTGTGGCWGPLKIRPWHGFFLKSFHCSQEELRATHVCQGAKYGPSLFQGKAGIFALPIGKNCLRWSKTEVNFFLSFFFFHYCIQYWKVRRTKYLLSVGYLSVQTFVVLPTGQNQL